MNCFIAQLPDGTVKERCELCNFISDSVENVVIHKKEEHPDVPLFTCVAEGCNKEFSRPFQLTKHMRLSHDFGTENMKMVCMVCNDKFPTCQFRNVSSILEIFLFNVAISSFSVKDLQKHSKVHNTQDFMCHICCKVFLSRAGLKKHLPNHEEKKFECKMGCDKKFSRKNKLDRHHKTVHATSTDFTCPRDGCEKAYRRKDTLNEHIQSIHDEKQFQCEHCSKMFAFRQRLLKHMLRKHI